MKSTQGSGDRVQNGYKRAELRGEQKERRSVIVLHQLRAFCTILLLWKDANLQVGGEVGFTTSSRMGAIQGYKDTQTSALSG